MSFTPGIIQELRTKCTCAQVHRSQASMDSFTSHLLIWVPPCGMRQVQYTIAINKKTRSMEAWLGEWIEGSPP